MKKLVTTAHDSHNVISNLRDQLRHETRQEHHDLEKALDLFFAQFNVTDYGNLLVKFFVFHVAFDAYLAVKGLEGSSAEKFYLDGRSKKNWLAQDMDFMGIDNVVDIRKLSHDDFAILLPSTEHIWGAIYVIEGSTLGGEILARHFTKTLGLFPEAGLRFFTAYGAETNAKWNETIRQLESLAKQDVRHANIIVGAKRTFGFLKQHLTGGMAGQP
jgi:heme oxygenase